MISQIEKKMHKLFCKQYVGVNFANSAKVYSFLCMEEGDLINHLVLVQTQFGVQLGRITKLYEAGSYESKQATAWVIADVTDIAEAWKDHKAWMYEHAKETIKLDKKHLHTPAEFCKFVNDKEQMLKSKWFFDFTKKMAAFTKKREKVQENTKEHARQKEINFATDYGTFEKRFLAHTAGKLPKDIFDEE